jgi:hypothetical protein
MSLFRGERRRLVALALLLALTLLAPVLASAQPPVAPPSDLGDAPDSTNHFGVVYLAYPGTPGRFPTVFDPATGIPQGPLHNNTFANGWLGAGISGERDADLMPDADGITNLDPGTATPNRDRFDDGVAPVNPGGINLPHCGTTAFRYIVTGAAAVPAPNAFVNVWIDFNRDGDWADRFTCTTPTGAILGVQEWAVRNQPVVIVPGSVVWGTPVFPSAHLFPVPTRDSWMRISIAEQMAPANPLTGIRDGSGLPNGYRLGETEDYYLRYTGTGTLFFPT